MSSLSQSYSCFGLIDFVLPEQSSALPARKGHHCSRRRKSITFDGYLQLLLSVIIRLSLSFEARGNHAVFGLIALSNADAKSGAVMDAAFDYVSGPLRLGNELLQLL